VPRETTAEVEEFWHRTKVLHPAWDLVTLRDPIDPDQFPLTSRCWPLCTSGAQFAGLIRLEALFTHGGIWLDSDMELYRPLDPLLPLEAFAAWEDHEVVPDAVLGATAGHPAIEACLALAILRLGANDPNWRTGSGAWATGPGVTTTVLPGRSDVLLLPPGSFYPVHYRNKKHAAWNRVSGQQPWAFGAHRWHASWVPKEV
jgi:mannosyltransferase OCH1-like enzyme